MSHTDPETSPPGLVIRLFGPMAVEVGGQPLPRLRSRRSLYLLALLTLRHGRPVEREWLAGTLWPDADSAQGFANLRPVLSALRDALGPEGARIQSPNRHSLLLDLTGADVDLLAFDAAMGGGSASGLAEAVALYQGPLLEGCVEEWVFQDRDARAGSLLRGLQTLALAAVEAENHSLAAHWWRRATALDRSGRRRGISPLFRFCVITITLLSPGGSVSASLPGMCEPSLLGGLWDSPPRFVSPSGSLCAASVIRSVVGTPLKRSRENFRDFSGECFGGVPITLRITTGPEDRVAPRKDANSGSLFPNSFPSQRLLT